MALSQFSFKIEFISGVNNDIADSLSRLCRNNMVDHPQEYSLETIMSVNIIEKFKLTREQYNIKSNVHNSQVGHFGLERTFRIMAIRRIRKTAAAKAATNTTDNTSATISRAQPRPIAVAAHQRFLEHTQHNVQDIESPGSPAI